MCVAENLVLTLYIDIYTC